MEFFVSGCRTLRGLWCIDEGARLATRCYASCAERPHWAMGHGPRFGASVAKVISGTDMAPILALLAIGLASAAGQIGAGTQAVDKVLQTQLASRYAKWDGAYRANDAKTLVSMLHPRFRIVTMSGKVISRSDYVKGLGKGAAPEKYQTTLLRCEGGRWKALAWTRELSQKPGGDAHVHLYRDTWAKSGGHWLLLESRTLSEE